MTVVPGINLGSCVSNPSYPAALCLQWSGHQGRRWAIFTRYWTL